MEATQEYEKGLCTHCFGVLGHLFAYQGGFCCCFFLLLRLSYISAKELGKEDSGWGRASKVYLSLFHVTASERALAEESCHRLYHRILGLGVLLLLALLFSFFV